jgi:hypothetical protein
MKFNLTPALTQAIKTAIKNDRDDKWRAATSVNVITTDMDTVASIKSAFEKADADFKAIQSLTSGTVDFTNGFLIWNSPDDNRPAGWKEGYSYRVKSRTGGPDHEVTYSVVGVNKAGSHVSCNCTGGRFGEKCWAQKAVEGHASLLGPSLVGNRNFTRVYSDVRSPDFGLIKPLEG